MRLALIAHTNALWTPDYARFFQARGDDVLVISFAPDRIEGVDVEFVGVEPFEKYGNKHLFLTRVPRIRRILSRFRPDLVFAPYLASNGLTAALAWHGTLVVTAVGSDVLEQPGRRGARRWLNRAITRFVCGRANVVQTVSRNLDAALVAMGVPSQKLLRIPIGIDLERFRAGPERSREGAPLIVCTRKHEPVYDMPTIIDALAILARDGVSFRASFAGGGHLIDAHRERVRAAGLAERVELLGHVSPERMGELLRRGDVYVSASLSDGTSSALLEAMAVGLLPVVTAIDANTPWVEDGSTGLLFAPGDAQALATALRTALSSPALRSAAARENRRRVELEGDQRKNSERLALRFEELVRSACR